MDVCNNLVTEVDGSLLLTNVATNILRVKTYKIVFTIKKTTHFISNEKPISQVVGLMGRTCQSVHFLLFRRLCRLQESKRDICKVVVGSRFFHGV